jgi:hypothetical protein
MIRVIDEQLQKTSGFVRTRDELPLTKIERITNNRMDAK